MDRILRGTSGTLELKTYDSTGALADVFGTSAPTVAVTDSSGATVADTFTPSRSSTGDYLCSVPTTLTALDSYTVTWTWVGNGQTRQTQFELVGSFLFSIAEFRASHPDLTDTTNFPTASIVTRRTQVEEAFERFGNVSFTRRGARDSLDGKGLDTLMLSSRKPSSVVSVTMDGTAFDAGSLADLKLYDDGRLKRAKLGYFTTGTENVVVFYEHGYLYPPEPIKEAAYLYARLLMSRPAWDERVTGVSTEGGNFYRLTLAGKDGYTGVPRVDAALKAFGYQQAGAFA